MARPKKDFVMIRLDPKVYDRLKKLAKAERRTIQGQLEITLDKALRGHESA